jgi:hypothetical protein
VGRTPTAVSNIQEGEVNGVILSDDSCLILAALLCGSEVFFSFNCTPLML